MKSDKFKYMEKKYNLMTVYLIRRNKSMIPADHAVMLYKFGQSRWINKMLNGEISFSCPGAFIRQAKLTGNIVQGDELEGVFARQRKGSAKVGLIRNKFENDLEEIVDGDYILFRRKSSRFIPIFCIYAYTANDILKEGKPKKTESKKMALEFDERIYEGFANDKVKNVISDENRFTMTFIQPQYFKNKITVALKLNDEKYKSQYVDYRDMSKNEFYIEPTDEYPELFVKSKDYDYQHELRICLYERKFKTISQRYNLNVHKFDPDNYEVVHDKVRVEYTAKFQKI